MKIQNILNSKYVVIILLIIFTNVYDIKGQEADSCINIKKIFVYKATSSNLINLLDSVINYEEVFIKKLTNEKRVFFISANTYKYDSLVQITLYSNPKIFGSLPEGLIYYRDYLFCMYDGFVKIARKNKLIKRIQKENFTIVPPYCFLIDLSNTIIWYWKYIDKDFVLIHKSECRY